MLPKQLNKTAQLPKAASATMLMMALMVTLLLVPAQPLWATKQSAQSGNWLDAPVTIQSQDEQLHKVLKRIADQTGIVIYYDPQLAQEKIRGNYNNIKASEAIKRLFSGRNKIILIDDKEKAIIVKTFGVKNFARVATSQSQDAAIALTRITLAELDELHDLQVTEFVEEMADRTLPAANNLTLAELDALHAEQELTLQDDGLSDDTKIPGTGITHSTLQALHEQQDKELQERFSDDPLFPDSRLTLSSLETLHEEQNLEFQDNVSENAHIISLSEIALDDLQTLHDRQQQDFENTLQDRSGYLR